ncbi:MAG: thioredoxin family protein [Bacteroidales bacterium]
MYKVLMIIAVMLVSANVNAQMNQITFDTTAQKDILIGECNREGLMLPLFSEFFNQEYSHYTAAPAILPLLIAKGNHYNIVIIMATWCGDSREQVPRFIKIADSIGFPETEIRIINVDKQKKAPGIEEELLSYGIERVPTFIFFDGETEIGRIIETPHESLEADWLKILEKK